MKASQAYFFKIESIILKLDEIYKFNNLRKLIS